MRKLATAAISYAAAIFLACYLVPARHWVLAAVTSIACLIPAFFLKGDKRLRVILITAGLSVGFLWNAGYSAVFIEPLRLFAEEKRTIEARVVEFPVHYEYGSTVVLKITSGEPHGAAVRCRYIPVNDLDLTPGDIVMAELQYSNAEYLDSSLAGGYSANAYLSGKAQGEVKLIGRSGMAFIYSPLYLARAIKNKAVELWPADAAPFQLALLTGECSLLWEDRALTFAMSQTGITHIVSVSGMHVTFLIGFIYALFKNKKLKVAICLPVIIIFALMTGLAPSIVRASLMQVFVLSAPLASREADNMTSFSAALLLILLQNPAAGYNIGLQLSFAAVLGIIIFTERIQNALKKLAVRKSTERKKPAELAVKFLIDNFAVTMGALVFTTPLIAIYFGYVPLYSVVANMLTLGVISLLFQTGFLICALGAVFPAAGIILASLTSWGIRYVIFAIKFIASLPLAAVYTSYNLAAWWIVFVYVIFAVLYIKKARDGFRPVLPVCMSASVLFVILFLSTLRPPSVAAVDVGQGQSIVLISESGTAVVDCGSLNNNRAGETTAGYLLSRGKRRVDILILTHLHADHANGVSDLMEIMNVELLVLPLDSDDDDGLLREILTAAERSGARVAFLAGDAEYMIGSLRLELVAPIGSGSVNERGIIILGTIGDFDVIITGDVDAAMERRLLLRRELSRQELLIVGHHGSRHSTSEEFLDAVEPVVAFISVGQNNFGHPAEETLERLDASGAVIYRTDLQGNIEARIR